MIEEKIAEVMKGKKGTIMFDGCWSKFLTHYVAMIATHLKGTGEKDIFDEEKMEAVMSLITCATLPYADDNSNGGAIDKDSGDINGVEDGGDIDG